MRQYDQGYGRSESMAVSDTVPPVQDFEEQGTSKATLWVSSKTLGADVWIALRVIDGDREVPYYIRTWLIQRRPAGEWHSNIPSHEHRDSQGFPDSYLAPS